MEAYLVIHSIKFERRVYKPDDILIGFPKKIAPLIEDGIVVKVEDYKKKVEKEIDDKEAGYKAEIEAKRAEAKVLFDDLDIKIEKEGGKVRKAQEEKDRQENEFADKIVDRMEQRQKQSSQENQQDQTSESKDLV